LYSHATLMVTNDSGAGALFLSRRIADHRAVRGRKRRSFISRLAIHARSMRD
jgi:hypothetical protein